MLKAPDVPAAIAMTESVLAYCVFMRQLVTNQPEANLSKTEWQGLGRVFENIMADLECILSDLDPA